MKEVTELVEVTSKYTWIDLVGSRMIWLSVRRSFLAWVWYTKPVFGRLVSKETRDGWEVAHPALKRVLQVPWSYNEYSAHSMGIRLYDKS